MSLFTGYRAASGTDSRGPQPGARALMAWFLGAYRSKGARNDGIYNFRPVRGSTAPSVHGEGRAADLGCKAGDAWAQALANKLVAHSRELGIQCVIFNGRIWSGAHPDSGWRHYSGVDRHTTHLHVELSWAAAKGSKALTSARIRAVLTPPPPVIKRTLKIGSHGSDVKAVQRRLIAHGVLGKGQDDGVFGPHTRAAVLAFKAARHYAGMDHNAYVGRGTVRALGGLTWKA